MTIDETWDHNSSLHIRDQSSILYSFGNSMIRFLSDVFDEIVRNEHAM